MKSQIIVVHFVDQAWIHCKNGISFRVIAFWEYIVFTIRWCGSGQLDFDWQLGASEVQLWLVWYRCDGFSKIGWFQSATRRILCSTVIIICSERCRRFKFWRRINSAKSRYNILMMFTWLVMLCSIHRPHYAWHPSARLSVTTMNWRFKISRKLGVGDNDVCIYHV